MTRYEISNEGDTARLAGAIASMLRGGLVFGLSGDLGAGKTTFVRYVIAAAGGDTRAVASPTYTLQHEYRLPSGLIVEHWDLYRLLNVPLDLDEEVGKNVIRFIEWPERCPDIIPQLTCELAFSHVEDHTGQPGEKRVLEVHRDAKGEVTRALNVLVNGA